MCRPPRRHRPRGPSLPACLSPPTLRPDVLHLRCLSPVYVAVSTVLPSVLCCCQYRVAVSTVLLSLPCCRQYCWRQYCVAVSTVLLSALCCSQDCVFSTLLMSALFCSQHCVDVSTVLQSALCCSQHSAAVSTVPVLGVSLLCHNRMFLVVEGDGYFSCVW